MERELKMISLREVLKQAEADKVAVGHFNFSDLVAFNAIVAAARDQKLPVMVGVSEGEREFTGVRQAAALTVAAVVVSAAASGTVVHLVDDHSKNSSNTAASTAASPSGGAASSSATSSRTRSRTWSTSSARWPQAVQKTTSASCGSCPCPSSYVCALARREWRHCNEAGFPDADPDQRGSASA